MTGAAERAVIETALDVANELVDELRPDLLAAFGGGRAQLKHDGTYVTASDVDANERIADRLQRRFPDHGLVSEELDTAYGGATWCWIVDPIDGTTNFVRGTPTWCVSVALAFEGRPVLGLLDAPALGVRYHAVSGGGAFADGERLQVLDADWSDPQQLENALVGVSSGLGRLYTVDTPLKPRVLGSAALHLASVAQGSMAAAALTGTRVWDVAAGTLLVLEAGGVLVDVSGRAAFPLEAGVDYRDRTHRFVAAASERTARSVITGFQLR